MKLWVVTHNAKRQETGGWAVSDETTEVDTWLATHHFGPYRAIWVAREALSDQSAGHVKL